jgi:CheY-like chemotaxis protein
LLSGIGNHLRQTTEDGQFCIEMDMDNNLGENIHHAPFSGKRVILAVPESEEQEAFREMLNEMQIDVLVASSAVETLELLEDFPSHLLIMDLNQPDMHGWQMINKIREITEIRNLPITVLTDQPNIGITVARVDYLTRPVSIARLRQSVTNALENSA